MPCVNSVLRIVPADRDEDRAVHHSNESGDTILLADGAGGISGGRRAAELVVAAASRDLTLRAHAVSELARVDRVLDEDPHAGECTGVIVLIQNDGISGASVGDSGAWLITTRGVVDLTEHQRRKPLLGSASAQPVGFGPVPLEGRLLVASDGLLKYVPRQRIEDLARLPEIEDAAAQLVEAARLPSGGLQDDLSLLLIEAIAPTKRGDLNRTG